ncbi:MAG: tRNA pseudouridine(38-40) synthase TruA [Elusimicrobiota bacterium]
MPNYLLIIEYDGSGFHGWQKQPRCRTVQGEIEKAAAKILGRPVKVTGAGRTDAGVHAKGQAANIFANKDFKAQGLVPALNAHLPDSVSVVSARRVPDGFNARRAAKEKIYSYRVWNRQFRSVWAQKTSWHIKRQLDMEKVKETAEKLIGRHDFGAYASAGGVSENKSVNLKKIKVRRKNGFTIFTFTADRFLYRMIRNIMGTLVEAGRGRLDPKKAGQALKEGKRNFGITAAPPQGLFLDKVKY